jgi:hypothetical protein
MAGAIERAHCNGACSAEMLGHDGLAQDAAGLADAVHTHPKPGRAQYGNNSWQDLTR